MLLRTYSVLSTSEAEFDEFISKIVDGNLINRIPLNDRVVLHFTECGALTDSIDHSPAIRIAPPRRVTEFLWKAGMLHIQQNGMSKLNPKFHKETKKILSLLDSERVVWDHKNLMRGGEYNYYLRGSIQNISWKIIALESGMRHLEHQWHYVSADDNEFVIDKELKSLRMLGLT